MREGGRLAFVISQSFLKSKKGGEGFRKLRITRDGHDDALKVLYADDMVTLKPFQGVANRTAVLVLQKGKATEYPLPYYVWTKKTKGVIDANLSLQSVSNMVDIDELRASPIDKNDLRSPWLTVPEHLLAPIYELLGKTKYKGRKGVEPLGAKGVYFIHEPKVLPDGLCRIENDLSRGRLPIIKKMGVIPGIVEPDLLYPILSGRNIQRWGTLGCSWCVFPHINANGPHNAIPESEMKVSHIKTFQWLSKWRDILYSTRQKNGKFFDPDIDPFYALDNVGTYTFAPYKVAWCEQGAIMTACVLSSMNTLIGNRTTLVDSKVLFCPLNSEEESHYLCAMLNSRVISYIIDSYTIETQRGIDVLAMINIPTYDKENTDHCTLSKFSQNIHIRVANGEIVHQYVTEIDVLAATILGLPLDHQIGLVK